MSADDSLPNDVETLKAMLIVERAARLAAESEAQYRALLIEKLKSTIKKLRHEQFGQSSERGALLDQLELQLADLEEDAAQAEAAVIAEKITAPAGTAPAARASAARTHRLPGTVELSLLWRDDPAQDRRGCDGDAGAHPAPMEGDATRPGEVLLSEL